MNVMIFNRQEKKKKLTKRSQKVRTAIVSLGIFDAEWYLSFYPDVADSGMDPLDHFTAFGDREGRSPHPLFDAQWYLERYPDVAAAGVSPVLHYIERGASEGRDPGPYFSTSFYWANNRSIAIVGGNPLAHFVAQWGAERGPTTRAAILKRSEDRRHDPHPLFDLRWYLSSYGKLIPDHVNPVAYHAATGHKKGWDTHPLIDSAWYRRAYPERADAPCVLQDYLAASTAEVRCPSPLFDRQWYIDTYRDSLDPGRDPLVDYVLDGCEAGRLPHPLFASSWYVARHRRAAKYPGGPLCHFREIGSGRGASPHPLFDMAYFVERYPEAAQDPGGPLVYYLLNGTESALQPHPLFDPRWYVACNPEANDIPTTPLTHFLGYGIWHDRDPHPLFDTEWYLRNYPQARQPFVHPLVHYLEKGSSLNYWPTAFFDPQFYAANCLDSAGTDPLIHFARFGLERGKAPNADALATLHSPPAPDVYHASGCTYSDYVRAIGLTSRLVLACDATKRDPVAYAYYLKCLTANASKWRIPANKSKRPLVSVILPTYNGLHFTIACIESIGRFLPAIQFELIVADNVSTDATESVLRQRTDIRYIRHPENLGFLRSCNRAARFAKGEFIFLLNNDTLVAPGWLDELFAVFCLHENVGLVGSKLIYPDGRLQEAGGIIWKDGSAWNYGKFQDPGHPEFNYVRETDYCSGAAIMLPKRLWDEVGGFDEMYVPSYCEDSDLALRVRSLGYSVLYAPHSVVAHFEGMTQGRDTSTGIKSFQVSNTEKLLARWKPLIGQYQANGKDLHLAKDRGFTKRALFLDECTPAPREDAGSVTALNLMRLLRSRGYLVTFIPRSNYLYFNDLTRDLQREGIEVLYGHYVNSVDEHLEQHGHRYDIIFMMRPQSFSNHIEAVREHAPQARLIYHTCDLHYLRFAREAELTGSAKSKKLAKQFKVIEHDALCSVHASIVHSTLEYDVLRKELPKLDNVHVFGWAIPVPGAKHPYEGREGAIFVGGFNHGPNVDAVLYFVNDVLPIIWQQQPEFTFHVVGSKTPDEILRLASQRVVVHGFVENLEPLFDKVQIAVAPLRYGAGIKGKIATAMSVGLPNVVTTIGAEGMGLTSGVDCIVADTPDQIAAAVLALTHDRALWNRISHNCAVFCERTYGTSAAQDIFDAILKDAGLAVEDPVVPRLVSPTGGEPGHAWPAPLVPLAVITTGKQWQAFQRSPTWTRVAARDRFARIRMHDRPELGYPAYCMVTGKREVLAVQDVSLDEAAGSLRDTLRCPQSGLGNFDRLLLSLVDQTAGPSGAVYCENSALTAVLGASHTLIQTPGDADCIVAEAFDRLADLKPKPGTTVLIPVLSMKQGLALSKEMRESGWSEAAVEVYHAPEYGHLGNDLMVARAVV